MNAAQAKSLLIHNSTQVESSAEMQAEIPAESAAPRRSLRENLLAIGFVSAALIATAGWLWLLGWIVFMIL
jgi:hypothetical protein